MKKKNVFTLIKRPLLDSDASSSARRFAGLIDGGHVPLVCSSLTHSLRSLYRSVSFLSLLLQSALNLFFISLSLALVCLLSTLCLPA